MANAFCHMELNTTDPDRARTFYGNLFSWKYSEMDMGPAGTYTLIQPGEGPGGGMMKHPVPGAPSSWLVYVQVDDIRSATDKAKSLGAQVMKEVTEVPNAGSFSIILDPTGAPLGLWQPKA